MEFVTLVHPTLPGQPIRVAPHTVQHYENCGWRRDTDDAATYEEDLTDGSSDLSGS